MHSAQRNRKARTAVIIPLFLSGVFAVNAVFRLIVHSDFSKFFSGLFLIVIFLLNGLIFTDIRKNGKPFAKSVICKSGVYVEITEYIKNPPAPGKRAGGKFQESVVRLFGYSFAMMR